MNLGDGYWGGKTATPAAPAWYPAVCQNVLMPQPLVYRMRFDGRILRRGFWLYVWDVRSDSQRVLYVGRTGDSSSPNAASPFARVGQHLNFSANAKANSMAKQLAEAGVDPECCEF